MRDHAPVGRPLSVGLPETACPVCYLHKAACLCSSTPSLQSRALFFLLLHERELAKPTNTGRLVINGFPGTQSAVWSRVEPPPELLSLIRRDDLAPYIIFPAELVSDSVEVVSGPVGTRQPLFILIDATWQQARKMYRQSLYLQALPVLSLKPGEESRYQLRRNQQAGHLATAEVVVELLQLMDEGQQADTFEHYFETFQKHYEASRSGHGLTLGAGEGKES